MTGFSKGGASTPQDYVQSPEVQGFKPYRYAIPQGNLADLWRQHMGQWQQGMGSNTSGASPYSTAGISSVPSPSDPNTQPINAGPMPPPAPQTPPVATGSTQEPASPYGGGVGPSPVAAQGNAANSAFAGNSPYQAAANRDIALAILGRA